METIEYLFIGSLVLSFVGLLMGLKQKEKEREGKTLPFEEKDHIEQEKTIEEELSHILNITDLKEGKKYYGNRMISFKCSMCGKTKRMGLKKLKEEGYVCGCQEEKEEDMCIKTHINTIEQKTEDIKEEPKGKVGVSYVYFLTVPFDKQVKMKDIGKIGITNSLYSRLTGRYGASKKDKTRRSKHKGLLKQHPQINLDKSFFLKVNNRKESQDLEKYFHTMFKELNFYYHIQGKKVSGGTEWFQKYEKEVLPKVKEYCKEKNIKIVPFSAIKGLKTQMENNK